jgi:hypothetical protein
MESRAEASDLPCAETAREGAVQPLSPPFIRDLLLPDWNIAAVVASLMVVWRQWSAQQGVWGVWWRRMIGFEGGSGALVGHFF